jgi:phenylalanine-4-hydroxylase
MTEKYPQYDYLFHNVKPNAVGGIRIFGRHDPYLKPQRYQAVTDQEHHIWARLYQRLEPLLDRYATREYLEGLRALPIPRDRFPCFDDISPVLKQATGWTLIPVAGFLDEELFFDLNAQRRFPVTDIIRNSPRFEEKYAGVDIQNDEGYTPEPDIFHDVQAHVPFLMDRPYADLLAAMGALGSELLRDERGLGPELVAHNLKRLQNFAWWTYEFGVVRKSESTDRLRQQPNDIPYEIYGAGIISSYDETLNVIHCARGESDTSRFLPFDVEEIVLTRFDYSALQDRYYVAESMEAVYAAFYDNQELFWFEG